MSYHAVTRYVQRILSVCVDWARSPLSAAEIAEAHCLSAGTTIEDVRSRILTPAVRAGIALGVPFIRTAEFEARIRAGIVTTITERREVHRPKLQCRTRKEARRSARKQQRRMKRRPAAEDLQP